MANTPVERKLEEVLDAIDTILEDCNEVLASKGKPPVRVIADLPDAVEGGIESSALIDTDKGLGIEVIEQEEYIYVKVDNSTIKFNANGQLYADISGLEILTVNELPTASASTFGKLYLIPSASSKTRNVKDEYITIQSGSSYDWEQIGSTEIDLTDYATKAWVEAKGYALDSDLADVAKSGDYEDLINTPIIPGQEQADWNESDPDAVSYIQNKPTIPAETPIATAQVAGKVKPDGTSITVDNDGTIHSIGGSGTQVQVDWNQTDTTQVDFIKNKPTIPDVSYTVNKVNEIFGTGASGDFNFVIPTGQTVGNRQNKSNMTCYTILTTNSAGTVPYYIEFYVPIFPNNYFTFFYFLFSSKTGISIYGHYNDSDTVNVPNYFEWYIYGADGNIIKSGTYTFSGDNTTNYRWKGNCASSVAFIPSNTGDYVNTDKMVILNDVPTKPDSITTRYTRPTTEGYNFGTPAIAIPFTYTINSGVDTSSPWRALNNKVTTLESRENIRTYYDSTTGTLYLTNDGSDPTPSNE